VKLVRIRKPNATCFLSYVEYKLNTNACNMIRKGHILESEDKGRKLKRSIWLIYFLYKNEYRIFKPVKITMRKRLMWKGDPVQGIMHIYMEMSQ
jgi:hypothetical protein